MLTIICFFSSNGTTTPTVTTLIITEKGSAVFSVKTRGTFGLFLDSETVQKSTLKSHGDRADKVSLQVGGSRVSGDEVGPNFLDMEEV